MWSMSIGFHRLLDHRYWSPTHYLSKDKSSPQLHSKPHRRRSKNMCSAGWPPRSGWRVRRRTTCNPPQPRKDMLNVMLGGHWSRITYLTSLLTVLWCRPILVVWLAIRTVVFKFVLAQHQQPHFGLGPCFPQEAGTGMSVALSLFHHLHHVAVFASVNGKYLREPHCSPSTP